MDVSESKILDNPMTSMCNSLKQVEIAAKNSGVLGFRPWVKTTNTAIGFHWTENVMWMYDIRTPSKINQIQDCTKPQPSPLTTFKTIRRANPIKLSPGITSIGLKAACLNQTPLGAVVCFLIKKKEGLYVSRYTPDNMGPFSEVHCLASVSANQDLSLVPVAQQRLFIEQAQGYKLEFKEITHALEEYDGILYCCFWHVTCSHISCKPLELAIPLLSGAEHYFPDPINIDKLHRKFLKRSRICNDGPESKRIRLC